MKNILYAVLRKFNLDLKIIFKLIIFCIIISIIPLFLISAIFNSKINNFYKNKLDESYKQVIDQYISNINYKCEIYQSYLTNISLNKNIYEIIDEDKGYTNENLFDIGKKISDQVGVLIKTRNDLELRNIMVYIYNESIPIHSRKITNVRKEKYKDWYIDLQNNISKGFITYDINYGRQQVLSLIQQLIITSEQNYGKKIGFVKIDLNTDNFFNISNTYNDNCKKDIYILDSENKLIWKSEGSNFNCVKNYIDNIIVLNKKGNKSIDIENDKKRMYIQNTNKYGWKVIFLFDNYQFDKNKREIIILTIKCIVGLITVLILITVLFSRKFSNRIDLLISKMEKVESGNLQISNIIEGTDEIGILDRHFNKMVYKIKELININYVEKLEKREAELKALQFQINPHFLYNTLETIDSLAAINECYEICEISYKLGQMFRYSINKESNDFVLLKEEIKHIENYIYIQRVRFKDRFEVFYNIDKKARESKVLKFILQPIIENCIIHGFQKAEKCYSIEISSSIMNDCLNILIVDDGQGINKELVEEINTYINMKEENENFYPKKSIGIRNVNMRIKYFYGNKYGLELKSKANLGTAVTITLPAK